MSRDKSPPVTLCVPEAASSLLECQRSLGPPAFWWHFVHLTNGETKAGDALAPNGRKWFQDAKACILRAFYGLLQGGISDMGGG